MLEVINVLSELERLGITYEWAADDEVKCKCPFHEDTTPSCSINVQKRMYVCHAAGCKSGGDIVTLLAGFLKVTRATVMVELSKRYDMATERIIDPDIIERDHARIWAAGPLRSELYKRAVTDDLIRKYRLGERDGRITIPIKSEAGHFVNVRKYLPGAPGADKMKNTRGRGKIRLYPVEQMTYDTVVVCGGEMKAIVAADHLNKHNIGAVSPTGGEGNWSAELTKLFIGKTVYVCLDIDEAGQVAANQLCAQLNRVAQWTGNILLALDAEKFPHGDINDFVASGGSMKRAVNSAKKWEPPSVAEKPDEDPTETTLVSAVTAKFTSRRIKVRAVVSALDTAPYVVPKEVIVKCERDQTPCAVCPVMYIASDAPMIKIHPESAAILDMVSSPKSAQREAVMEGCGIPRLCKTCEFETKSYYNVEDVRVSPQLEITSRSVDRVLQPGLAIGEGLELNESYDMIGRPLPHPKTQQSTLLVSSYTPAHDALSTYVCGDIETLKIFQPSEWTIDALKQKLDDIYGDFEANVTRIFQRRNLHLFTDLAYHSPLLLRFDDRTVKGWVEILIMGDSAQGKSETVMNIMKHYGLGEKIDCKNASVAGMLGGLQQMGSRWFVSWGIIPTHDKRLVVLEELKGANTEVISKLTDMRSSGIAEIPKIEKRRTHARTRLIALSNPRSGHPMSSYNFGVEAIKELIGGLEDVRRFDAALIVSAREVEARVLNELQKSRPTVEHLYTGERCRSLVLWSWTREAAHVVFDDEATKHVLERATALCDKFSESIPIVDRGSMRLKVARLAASLAARTFSTDDGQVLIIRACHVDFVADLLSDVYSSPVFGYLDYTKALEINNSLINPEIVKETINKLPYPRDFVNHMLHANGIDLFDLQDWCGWDRAQATQLLSLFVRKHALVRETRGYRKTPPFIKLLREMLESGELIDRPEFIPDMREEF